MGDCASMQGLLLTWIRFLKLDEWSGFPKLTGIPKINKLKKKKKIQY